MRHYQNIKRAEWRAANPSRYLRGKPVEYEGLITCRTCGTERPHTDFYIRIYEGKYTKRRRTDCRFCMVERARVSAERVEVADERWMVRREGILRRKYGIGNAEFDAMLAKQDGRCAICHQIPEPARANNRTGRRWTAFHVDHNHTTGAVRGLLCISCNLTIGRVEAGGLEDFIEYLNVWNSGALKKIAS